MDVLFILILFITGGIFFLLFLLFKKMTAPKEEKGVESFLLLQNQINEIMKMMDNRMGIMDSKIGMSGQEMARAVQSQFSESQKLISGISERVAKVMEMNAVEITKVVESNKQVFSLGEQLQNLEKVLKNQKQRGNLGEAGLELVLGNILPPDAYKLQYEFKNGDIVDAIIKTKDGLIPVDAKFSLDNYQRAANETDEIKKAELEKEFKNDLKKRIDETAKYIKPNEDTLPFAFMFIPAEGIYYDLMVNEVGALKSNTRNLIDYAYKDKNVIIVSPTTFAAYLQSVLYGFRAFKIEEQAVKIRKNVEDLRVHLNKYDEYMKKLGNNLATVINSYNTAHKELGKVDKDILRIGGESAGIEPLQLDKPQMEDSE